MTFRPALLHNRSGHRLDATHCAGPKVTELPLWGKADAPASPDERWPRVTRKTTPILRALGCPGRGGDAQRAPCPVLVHSGCCNRGPQTGGLQTAETPSSGRRQTWCQARARFLAHRRRPSLCPHMAEGKGAPWGLFYEVTDCMVGTPPS